MNTCQIFPIVVLYKTKISESKTINSILLNEDLLAYVKEIYVYDNSPVAQKPEKLDRPITIHYVSDPSNPGVSKAYNEGVKVGKSLGYEWVQFFDQDTQVPADFFKKLAESMVVHKTIRLFAPVLISGDTIISPYRFLLKRGTSPRAYANSEAYKIGLNKLETSGPVNSGIAVHVAGFLACGGYNEKIELDFSDFYFIEQFKRRSSEEFVVFDAICKHSISVQENTTLEAAYSRYRYYLSGSAEYETLFDSVLDRFIVRLNLVYWTLRLSLRFRSSSFFRLLWYSGMKPAKSA